jgi:mRNA interferase MazF
MARILRGSIHRAETRPVIVISHDVFNERSGTIIVMAITSQRQTAGYPLTYELRSPLQSKRAWIKMSQIRTLPAERIGRKIGEVSIEELDHILEGFFEIVGG